MDIKLQKERAIYLFKDMKEGETRKIAFTFEDCKACDDVKKEHSDKLKDCKMIPCGEKTDDKKANETFADSLGIREYPTMAEVHKSNGILKVCVIEGEEAKKCQIIKI